MDDVLTGKYGKVSGASIREAVRGVGKRLATETIEEAQRRYPDLQELLAKLIGLQVPFTASDLRKRLGPDADMTRAFEVLWSSGVLGMEIPKNAPGADTDTRLEETGSCRCYKRVDGTETRAAWYLFEYNWDGQVNDSLIRYGENLPFVFHSKMNEYLRPSSTRDRPLGA